MYPKYLCYAEKIVRDRGTLYPSKATEKRANHCLILVTPQIKKPLDRGAMASVRFELTTTGLREQSSATDLFLQGDIARKIEVKSLRQGL